MKESLEKIIMTDVELVTGSLLQADYFAILIERYEKKILRYLRRMTNVSSQDQEDILQNIFIKAYSHLNDFDTRLSFNSWMYRIAHNEIIDWARKSKTKTRNGYQDIEDTVFDRTTDGTHFLAELDIKEGTQEIITIMNMLDFKYKEVLYLKYIENYSYQEIGDILKKPQGTVGTLINRAKKKFKEHYENRA